MRITELQKKAIIGAVKKADPDARVWLFGSRADDSKKGGDIDIAVLSKNVYDEPMQKINIKRLICDKIGEQKIDIVTSANEEEAIFKLAMIEGVELV